MHKTIPKQFFRFALIGGVGFVVDAAVLTFLSQGLGLNLYLARGISFTIACGSTWLLNRSYTFSQVADKVKVTQQEYFRYTGVQIVGALINLLVFAVLLQLRPQLQSVPVVPLAVGAAFGLVFNFLGARLWVYPVRAG